MGQSWVCVVLLLFSEGVCELLCTVLHLIAEDQLQEQEEEHHICSSRLGLIR